MAMTKRLLLVALIGAFAVACGSPQTATRTEMNTGPAADAAAKCGDGDIASCIEIARHECAEPAWQLDFGKPPGMFVASTGLARLARMGMVLITTNTSEWLACMEECPGTEAHNVCIPFGLEMEFSYSPTGTCERRDREVKPWNTREAKSLLIDCPEGAGEITYVPSLMAVQNALLAAKAIPAGDELASLKGLVVDVRDRGVPVMSVWNVSQANCSAFDLPVGYKTIGGVKAFADLRQMHPGLTANYEIATRAVNASVEEATKKLVRKLRVQLQEVCTKAGFDVLNNDKYEECLSFNPTARALIKRSLSEELERLGLEAQPRLDAALRTEYIQPLCEHYLGGK